MARPAEEGGHGEPDRSGAHHRHHVTPSDAAPVAG